MYLSDKALIYTELVDYLHFSDLNEFLLPYYGLACRPEKGQEHNFLFCRKLHIHIVCKYAKNITKGQNFLSKLNLHQAIK